MSLFTVLPLTWLIFGMFGCLLGGQILSLFTVLPLAWLILGKCGRLLEGQILSLFTVLPPTWLILGMLGCLLGGQILSLFIVLPLTWFIFGVFGCLEARSCRYLRYSCSLGLPLCRWVPHVSDSGCLCYMSGLRMSPSRKVPYRVRG